MRQHGKLRLASILDSLEAWVRAVDRKTGFELIYFAITKFSHLMLLQKFNELGISGRPHNQK